MTPKEQWNELAAEHGLPKVKIWSRYREHRLQGMLREYPTFWEDVAEALGRRGRWAREKRFPDLDHLIDNDKYFVRLVEGRYDGRPKNGTSVKQKLDRDGKPYWGVDDGGE